MIPEIRINNIGIGNIGIGVVGDVGVPNVSAVSNVNIQDANIQDLNNIRVADTRIWTAAPPNVNQLDPPVVVNVGKPIVNMPGCVEVHKENAVSYTHLTLPTKA